MKLIIDISEEDYAQLDKWSVYYFREIISNGIPLPKEHGKIIDADSVPSYRIRGITEYCRGYNDRTTEVENAIVNALTIIEANY